MAAKLVMAGPRKLVFHMASHNLELIFYVLLGICVLFDAPHHLKTKTTLSKYFDVFQHVWAEPPEDGNDPVSAWLVV